MLHQLKKIFRRNNRQRNQEIYPDEIFLDSQNLPEFNVDQFEGRLERPIPNAVLNIILFFIISVGLVFSYKLWTLQVVNGQELRERSDKNSLHKTFIFADRGVIFDRNSVPIV